MMTYSETLAYLDSFINYEQTSTYDYRAVIDLERMRRLAALCGDPHRAVRAIHVAGSKGKGSTCVFIQSALRAAGLRAGLYTSPHLVTFRERIRINNELIGEADIVRLVALLRPAIEAMAGERPTYFEVITMLAYLYFREEKADIAVYETGLGGRLDATNIVTPLVSVIAPLSLEHTDKLGTDLAAIAGEKAGIIKEGGVTVSAPQEPEALAVLARVAAEQKNRFILVGSDITYTEIASARSGERFTVTTPRCTYEYLNANLLGTHQMINAATAIAALEALDGCGVAVPAHAVRRGIEEAHWEGRIDIIGENPFIILDGAQNRASAAALREAVRKIFSYARLTLVLGVSKDKDVGGIVDELVPGADHVIVTKADNPGRALSPDDLAAVVAKRGKKAVVTRDVAAALIAARAVAARDDLILVTGSLFVVGEVIAMIRGKAA